MRAWVGPSTSSGTNHSTSSGTDLSTVPFLHHVPIDNPPQRLQVRGAAVLVVEVVGVLPDVEGQEGLETVGGGVVGAGVLADGKSAIGIGLEPHPAGAEEGGAGGDERGLEGGEGAPLGLDLGLEGPGRPLDKLRDRPLDRLSNRRTELRKVQIMVQNLTGIVEHAPGRFLNNLLQGHRLKLGSGDELIQIIHIALQVLAMVERERAGGNDGLQRVNRIG